MTLGQLLVGQVQGHELQHQYLYRKEVRQDREVLQLGYVSHLWLHQA